MGKLIYLEFGKKGETVTNKNNLGTGVSAQVSAILFHSLPIDQGRGAEIGETALAFLRSLKSGSNIELHLGEDSLDENTVLCNTNKGSFIMHYIPLDTFLDLLTPKPRGQKPYSLDSVINFLGEIFETIGITFQEVYFSPKDYNTQIVEERWSEARLSDTLYIPGSHFYSIATIDPENEGLSVSPSIIADIKPSAILLDLVASYLEQTYEDSISKYDHQTFVEILRYSYKTKKTHTIRINYKTLESDAINMIQEQQPLLLNKRDSSSIIGVYLDGSLRREVDSPEIIEFPGRRK